MTSSLIPTVVILGISYFVWKHFRQLFVRSPLDNIPGPERENWLTGNLAEISSNRGWGLLDRLTESYQSVVKLYGGFSHRALWVYDPLALHHILLKDQLVFEEGQWFIRSNRLTFGMGLLSTLGEHHRKQRKQLNPVFSIAHMRRMIPIFNEIGHKLDQAIYNIVAHSSSGTVEIDMLEWMGRTALELIGQSGLGYSFDPLVSESADEFATAIKNLQPSVGRLNVPRRFLPYLPEKFMALQGAIFKMIPNDNVQKLRKVVDELTRGAKTIYEEKKRALEKGDDELAKQVGEGKDLISILMRENMKASAEDKMSEEELLGHMATFIFAAMDTTSTALSRTLEMLAHHPEVQNKVRQEMLEARNGDDLDYDTLVSLPYLDAVCRETLRLFPPVSFVTREARQDIVVPLSEPIKGVDGKMMNEIFVPKDTLVYVGIYSSNRSKVIWGEDALEWKPERWLSPLPSSVTDAKIPGVYSNLMTFIGGGRACIGFKFSQLEMKVVLVDLISRFIFAPPKKEVVWNLSGVQYPTMGYDDPKPTMPLTVSLYTPTSL